MDFKVWLRFPCHSTSKKRRFDPNNIIKVYLFLNSFSSEFYVQNLEYDLKFGSRVDI